MRREAIVRRLAPILIVVATLLGTATPAIAHARGETYVWLNVETDHLAGRIEVRLPDLRALLGIVIPEDLDAANAALPTVAPSIEAYLRDHVRIRDADGTDVPYRFVAREVLPAPKFGHFAAFDYRTDALEPVPSTVTVELDPLFDLDPRQRSLLCVEHDRIREASYGEEFTVAISHPSARMHVVDFANLGAPRLRLRTIAQRGALAWATPAHGLFLVGALLAAAIGVRRDDDPTNGATVGGAMRRALAAVVLLGLGLGAGVAAGAFGLVVLAPGAVAILLAVSAGLVALQLLARPFGDAMGWLLLQLGLVHGLALAAAFVDLPFRMRDLVRNLVLYAGGLETAMIGLAVVIAPVAVLLATRGPAGRRAVAALGLLAVLASGAAPFVGGAG